MMSPTTIAEMGEFICPCCKTSCEYRLVHHQTKWKGLVVGEFVEVVCCQCDNSFLKNALDESLPFSVLEQSEETTEACIRILVAYGVSAYFNGPWLIRGIQNAVYSFSGICLGSKDVQSRIEEAEENHDKLDDYIWNQQSGLDDETRSSLLLAGRTIDYQCTHDREQNKQRRFAQLLGIKKAKIQSEAERANSLGFQRLVELGQADPKMKDGHNVGWWVIPVCALLGLLFPLFSRSLRREVFSGGNGLLACAMISLMFAAAGGLLYANQFIKSPKWKVIYWLSAVVVGCVLVFIGAWIIADIMGV